MPHGIGPEVLQNLLQNYLISDSSAVENLPFILSSLSKSCFVLRPSLSKWIARINSLFQSKDVSVKWAAACVAHRSASLSKDLTVECAPTWVSNAILIISKNDSGFATKASIKLLAFIFETTADVPDLQRQVVVPNVPKCSTALFLLLQKCEDYSIRSIAIDALILLISLYPNLHRHIDTDISSYTLRLLDAPSSAPLDSLLAERIARLNVAIFNTGGKFQAVTRWRTSVNDAIKYCTSSLDALRTTLSHGGSTIPAKGARVSEVSASLCLERLRRGTYLLITLLRTRLSRAVNVPLGPIVSLCLNMLHSNYYDIEEPVSVHHANHVEQVSVVPHIWRLACLLAHTLVDCFSNYLLPHLLPILSIVAFHIEKSSNNSEKLLFMLLVSKLLSRSHGLCSPYIPGKLMKCILPLLDAFATQQIQFTIFQLDTRSSKEKGFKSSKLEALSPSNRPISPEDGETVHASLDALRYLMRCQNILPHVRAAVLKILLKLIQVFGVTPASPGSSYKDQILHKAENLLVSLTIESSRGTSIIAPIIIDKLIQTTSPASDYNKHLIELLIHPRLPPLIHNLPSATELILMDTSEVRSHDPANVESYIAQRPRSFAITMETQPINLVFGYTDQSGNSQEVLSSTVPTELTASSLPQKTAIKENSATTRRLDDYIQQSNANEIRQSLHEDSLAAPHQIMSSEQIQSAPNEQRSYLKDQTVNDLQLNPPAPNVRTRLASHASMSASKIVPDTVSSDEEAIPELNLESDTDSGFD